jgi:hypothetical protein
VQLISKRFDSVVIDFEDIAAAGIFGKGGRRG